MIVTVIKTKQKEEEKDYEERKKSMRRRKHCKNCETAQVEVWTDKDKECD